MHLLAEKDLVPSMIFSIMEKSQRKEEEKSPVLGGIRTLDLIVARRVFYLCATTTTHFLETN